MKITWTHFDDNLKAIEKLTEADEGLNTRIDTGSLLFKLKYPIFSILVYVWNYVLSGNVLYEDNVAQNYSA